MTEQGGISSYLTTVPCDTYILVSAEAVNACGTSIKANRGVSVRCSGGGMMFTASPNPVNTTTSVTVVDEKGELSRNSKEKFYELQLTDKFGAVKKQVKFAGGVQQAKIDLSMLPADLYFIRIWDGKGWSSLQILKK